MKKLLILLLSFSVFAVSCSSGGTDDTDAERTVLIYMAARNNLGSYAQSNFEDIVRAYSSAAEGENVNLLVYLDTPDDDPALLQVERNGYRTIKEYPDANSTSYTTLANVITYTVTEFPAERYSLVLWSHGTGWAPQGFPLLTKSLTYISAGSVGVPYPPTKTFGSQYHEGALYEMELDELKRAIPSGVFDYILFDACYMGAVEVAYALKDKADYIISSPSEVIAYGFPYSQITADMISVTSSTQNICISIARKYFDYYNAFSSSMYRAANVSVVRTDKLAALSNAVKVIVKSHGDEIAALTPSSAQVLDTYSRHFMYDLDSYMGLISTSAEYHAFSSALSDAVIYKASTPTMFDIPVNTFCGLSCYIPFSSYAEYTTHYTSTQWYRDTYM